jgi:Spy/CpxP family protein refolding chaperone
MRTREWTKITWMAVGLCFLALPVCARPQSSFQQTGDPVADAARKAREQKKNAPKAKKVFTDDDVKSAVPDKTSAPGAANTATAAAQKPGDTGPAEDPNSEKAWRKRFAEQHAKIDKAQQELDLLQRELDKSQLQYYNDPQKALNEQNNRNEINDKSAKIEAKKKEIDQLLQELDDLETQMRKAGGDPGWAR